MNENKQLQQVKKQKSSTQSKKSKSLQNKGVSSEGQAYQVVENTPFFVGKLANGRWAIGCNKTRTNITFTTDTEAIAYVKAQKIDWEMLGMFIQEMFNQIKNK